MSGSKWIWYMNNICHWFHLWNKKKNLETPSIIFPLTYSHKNSGIVPFKKNLCYHLNYLALTPFLYSPSVWFGFCPHSQRLPAGAKSPMVHSAIENALCSLSLLFQTLLPQVTWMKFFSPWLFPPVSCFRGRWGFSAECPTSRLGWLPGPTLNSLIHWPMVAAKTWGSKRGDIGFNDDFHVNLPKGKIF